MELFAAIRRDARVEGLSVRALAVRYRVHRRTVRQALAGAVPPLRKPPRRSSPALDAVRDLIDGMLRADLAAPVKQRHTCRRIFQRLVDEHDAQVSYSSVVNYVGHRRPQIIAEARDRAGVLDGFVPQTHAPGQDAEVDFGEAWVRLDGVLTKCHLFTFRLSFSGKAVHRCFLRITKIIDCCARGSGSRHGSMIAIGRCADLHISRSSGVTCGALRFMRQAGRMTREDFAVVERRIREHQGEQFLTRSGLPMTYEVDGDRIKSAGWSDGGRRWRARGGSGRWAPKPA